MTVKSIIILFLFLVFPLAVCFGEGEDFLSATGEYLFFVRSEHDPKVTYYKKMVPCEVEETVLELRKRKRAYSIPSAKLVTWPVRITETPEATESQEECLGVRCFPNSRTYSAKQDMRVTYAKSVTAPLMEIFPRQVNRNKKLPVWIRVQQEAAPLGAIKKAGR
jgi:hypothetical protein